MRIGIRKNGDIELLRAIAVMAVVVHHAHHSLFTWQVPYLETFYKYFGGGVGVDLFLVISGFVIARSFLVKLQGAETTTQRTSMVAAFWVRRIYRIFPLAWFWLFFILVATLFLNQSGVFGSFQVNWSGTVAAVLQVANFRFQECASSGGCGANFVYWSLSLEEQFYIALPLLALVFRRYLVWFLIACLLYKLLTNAMVFSFGLRYEGLILGVLLAIWSHHQSFRIFQPKSLSNSPLLGFALLVFFSVFLFSVQPKGFVSVPPLLKFKIAALVSTLLVWLAAYDCNYLMPDHWYKRLFLWLGSRSYALYLVHIPAFFLTREICFRLIGTDVPPEQYQAVFVLFAFVLLLVLADCSYRWIEVPLRRIGIDKSKTLLAHTEPETGLIKGDSARTTL